MKHKIFLAAAILAIFAAFTAGGRGSYTSSLDSGQESEQFTFAEYPWVNSNIIGRVPESYRPSPQEDFYVWTNHDWITSAALKPGNIETSGFSEIDDSIQANLIALMSDSSLQGHDADLVRNLYALWLDWDARNSEGVKAAQNAFTVISSLNSIDELTAYLASKDVNAKNRPSLFEVNVMADMNDSEYYCLYISPTALRLEDSEEYKSLTENGARAKKANDAKASYMLQRVGCSESEAQAIMDRAYNFEKAIAEYIMTREESRLPENRAAQNNPVTYDQLRSMSPVFPIADMLISADLVSDRLNLILPKWLEGMNALYTASSLEDIKAYLILRTVADGYISRSDEAAYREAMKISNEQNGITENAPDTESAFTFVNDMLPKPLTRIFVNKFVSSETKQDITEIIQDIIAEYRIMLQGEEWLSEATRAKAVEKLDAMKINVAYPDKYSDSDTINNLNIGTVSEGETLVSAIEKINMFNYECYSSVLNTRVDRNIWADEKVHQVNAYYNSLENSINILAGILSGDFYKPDASREENLGGIGTFIGHEISHAFDPNGALYDKDGNLSSWWTDEDFAAFSARVARIIDHANSITILEDGTKWNGSYTQTETIADIAALKVILNMAAKTEGFDYEKFFEVCASKWKRVATLEGISYLIQADVHPLNYLRANAIVQLFEEFHETYGTESGDRMYLSPEKIKELEVW